MRNGFYQRFSENKWVVSPEFLLSLSCYKFSGTSERMWSSGTVNLQQWNLICIHIKLLFVQNILGQSIWNVQFSMQVLPPRRKFADNLDPLPDVMGNNPWNPYVPRSHQFSAAESQFWVFGSYFWMYIWDGMWTAVTLVLLQCCSNVHKLNRGWCLLFWIILLPPQKKSPKIFLLFF